jgi:hypothetical protein
MALDTTVGMEIGEAKCYLDLPDPVHESIFIFLK